MTVQWKSYYDWTFWDLIFDLTTISYLLLELWQKRNALKIKLLRDHKYYMTYEPEKRYTHFHEPFSFHRINHCSSRVNVVWKSAKTCSSLVTISVVSLSTFIANKRNTCITFDSRDCIGNFISCLNIVYDDTKLIF